MCNLRWEHITWPAVPGAVPAARLERTKAQRGVYPERTVPLSDAAVAALRTLVQDGSDKPKAWPKSEWSSPRRNRPIAP